MDKQELLNLLIVSLEDNLQMLIHTAHVAKQAATNEESKAENKYDTRGLEASYLAGAQAKRAGELQTTIAVLSKLELKEFTDDSPADLTALIETELNGEETRWFFLLPKSGGEKIEFQGKTIRTLTPHSPLGKQLMGKVVSEFIEQPIKDRVNEYEIISLY